MNTPRARGVGLKSRQNAGMIRQNDAQDTAEYIPFEEFSHGLPQGRFRVVINPKLAVPFVSHRTHATTLALALIGPGGVEIGQRIDLERRAAGLKVMPH